MFRWLGAVGFLLITSACTTISTKTNGETSYRYSAFDFSGKTWALQKKQCEAHGMKPKHIETDCGFFLCISRYVCEGNP